MRDYTGAKWRVWLCVSTQEYNITNWESVVSSKSCEYG